MALEVLSIVITPVTEVGKYLVGKLKTEFDYVTKYNSYLLKFREELNQLQERRNGVQRDAEKAKKESKEPREEVLGWVRRVEDLEDKCRPLTPNNSTDNKCLMGLDCSRRRTSKQLLKLTKDICSLQEKGCFTNIADLPPSLDAVPMGPSGTVENIPSRELIKNEVMEALKDDNIRSIGVHGMGGIGKTTLVTSINDELCVTRSFKKVIMVTVSKDPDMKNIQNIIAERLDLKFEKEDMPTRANELLERLRSEESVLIILDDVWKPMELGEIGLGHNIEHMPCKLIVTTRNVDVCKRMDVKKVIKMDILPEDEAWALFEAKAGDVVVKTPSLERTAREIVGRCKGSPLAIATLGSTLRTKEEEEDAVSWAAHALQVLREPNAVCLEGIMDEVVKSLRLSYDQLKPNVQRCFLYCCLFPEDYNIRHTELRNCGIGEGFLKMASSLKEAQNELLHYVEILKDCCLLLGGDDYYENSVKMHDVVRDVAICIASNDEHGFLVNGSKYLPESDKLHTYKRISFMYNGHSLECPQLRSLLVHKTAWKQNISFEGVKSLLVLHMSGGGRWDRLSVPESISQLRNLRTLYLEGMNLVDKTYLLGGLTKLEVLSMRDSEIGELPVEFGNLINLKFLDLTDAYIDFVAPNVFSRFLKMEELLIADSIKGWDTTGELKDDDFGRWYIRGDGDYGRWCIREDGSRRYAELKEVLSLPRLSLLDIGIACPLSSHNFQNFRISVGCPDEMDDDFDCDVKTLHIRSTDLGKHRIKNLIAVSNKNLGLELTRCYGFKSVTDLNPAGTFNHLQYLFLEKCDDVESVIVADRSPITAQDSFERLERLALYNMDKMERILHGATSSTKFLGKLENLFVRNCSKLGTIFPCNLLFTNKRLENLSTLKVEECEEVQYIFNTEDNEFGATPTATAFLCGITNIHLFYLTKLKSIWKGIMPEGSFQGLTTLNVVACDSLQHLMPSDVAGLLQNLEQIKIEDCDAMETIIYPMGEEAEETSLLPRCRLLTVDSCPKLKSIFSFGVARHLHKLNKLSICHCHGLRQVFGNGDEPRVTEHRCLLPELKYLKLVYLMSLTRFDQDNLPISGPLEEIEVFVCPNFTRLPLQTISALKFIHAEDIWFKILELEDESQASILKPYFQATPVPSSYEINEKLHSLLWKVAGLWLDDNESQLEGTTQFRRLLSSSCLDDMPIWDVNKSGVVPCLVEFLTREDHTQLQSKAAWVLANIASRSSEHTNLVIDYGALPIFVKLLCSPNEDIREHAICALGKIARDSPKHRDLVLRHGGLIPLLAQLNDCAKVSILENAVSTISNLFVVEPQPPFEQMKLVLLALQRLLDSNNEIICTRACLELFCGLPRTIYRTQAIRETRLFPQLMKLLKHPHPSVLISALHTVGNLVSGDNRQTQYVITHQALPYLLDLLTHHEDSIKKDVCHVISNITAGNKERIQLVIAANIFAPLVHLLEVAELAIKREAARAISNATFSSSHEQIKHLIEQGCIKPFCDLLQCSDSDIVVLCLQGLFNILKVGETGGLGVLERYVEVIDDFGGFQNIKYLQGHDNSQIQQKAVDILKSFQLEKYRPYAGDATVASFQSGSKSNGVEKETISSKHKQVDLNNPPFSPYVRDSCSNASVEQYTFKVGPGTNNNRPLLRPKPTNKNVSKIGLVRKEKLVIARKDYGMTRADDPSCMTSLGNAKINLKYPPSSSIELAKEHNVDQILDEEPYIRDITSNASVKIDGNSSQSSSTKLAKQSHIIQTPEQELQYKETRRNIFMKLDFSSLSSKSTELENERYVSQMPKKDTHESDSTVWDSNQNVVIGESTSTATSSTHDEAWNDHSKHEHEDSIGLEVAESCTRQESSSDYTIMHSMKILDVMDMNMCALGKIARDSLEHQDLVLLHVAYLQGYDNSEIQQKAMDILKSFQLEKHTPSVGDTTVAYFQSGESESNYVEEETISSTEIENPTSKCKQIDLNNPPLSPYVRDSWSKATVEEYTYPPSSSIEIAKERHVDQILDEESYVRDITSNASVKIDDNSSQSSSTKLSKQSHTTQTPEQVLHHMETRRNFFKKLDLNSLPSSSTELEKEGYVSQMPKQDNHESDSMVWDSSQNVFMGGSTSIATTLAHDDVWNDQSKHEHEDSA